MPGKQLDPKCLYTRHSNDNAKKIIGDVESQKGIEAHECPWVEIGCIFSSLTITGDESWLPLIRLLRGTRGKKNFVVYSGRHGSIVNWTSPKGKPYNSLAPGLYEADKKKQEKAADEMTDIEIELIDVSGWDSSHTKMLKETTLSLRRNISSVAFIYAWCYSLFTFCEAEVPNETINHNQVVKPEAKLDELGPDLVYDSNHQIRKPEKWINLTGDVNQPLVLNKNYQAQLTAWQEAQKLGPLIEKRDREAFAQGKDKTIAKIASEYWIWAPA